jgi:hypothetical protein
MPTAALALGAAGHGLLPEALASALSRLMFDDQRSGAARRERG